MEEWPLQTLICLTHKAIPYRRQYTIFMITLGQTSASSKLPSVAVELTQTKLMFPDLLYDFITSYSFALIIRAKLIPLKEL